MGEMVIIPPHTESLQWDIDVPLLTNRYMLAALAKAMLGAGGIVTALVGLLLGLQGAWHSIAHIALLLLAISIGLFVLGVAAMAFPFRNRLASRFTIDKHGVHLTVTDGTVRGTNRLAFWMGLALGSGAAAGSGLLAATHESQALRWSGSFRTIPEPATRSIAFCNGWRTLLRVYCLPDNFSLAVDLVNREMAAHGTASRVAKRSPVVSYVARTLLVTVTCLPILAIAEIYSFSLLPPFVLLCFGVAMVWFVRPLAWVVLGMVGVIALLVVSGALEERTGYFNHAHYLRYQMLSGDSWALTALAAAGAATLVWLSVATLRGHIQPALAQDLMDGGNDA